MINFWLGIDKKAKFTYNFVTQFKRVLKNQKQKFLIKGKKMKFQPLGKRVLISREEEVKTTASGIIIPDNASKEKPSTGKIVEVGTECDGVKKGDIVAFAKYAGSEITLDDKKYLILNFEDVLGIIK